VPFARELRGSVVLVRHGQTTFVAENRFQGRLDAPLSELGERQAAVTAAWLATPGGPPGLGVEGLPREIVHSPLARAARFAEAIDAAIDAAIGRRAPARGADAAALPRLRPEPALVEIGQGEWEGRTLADVSARWGDELAAWRRDPTRTWAPGGESLRQVDVRVRSALPRLLATLASPSGTGRRADGGAGDPWTVVVGHDGTLRVLLLAMLDLPLERFWAFPFALAAATVIDVDGGQGLLRAHNLAGHLAASLGPGPAPSVQPDRGGAL
jgi:broad specificity phosphatase PhoE